MGKQSKMPIDNVRGIDIEMRKNYAHLAWNDAVVDIRAKTAHDAGNSD